MKAMSIFWIKKLLNGKSISAVIPRQILKSLDIEPNDLLSASLWELKYIAYHFKTYYGLYFWANIIERINEIRSMLNSYIEQEEIDIEPTTHIENKIESNKLIQKLKRSFDLSKLNDQPTIFSNQWRKIIRRFPSKIHLIGNKGNINQEIKENENNEKVMKLTTIMTEYKQRLGKDRNLNKIKSETLKDTIGQNSKKSLTARIYSAYAHSETQSKTNFSTPEKWNKKGFGYPKQTVKQAAKTIMKLKIPGAYKSTLIKHNLTGFVEPATLVKLGYKNTKECRLCHENDITYTHIIFDCPIAQFLINQAMLHFQILH